MKRRTFIPLGMAALAGCQQSTSFDPFADYSSLASACDRGELDPARITSHCLERIEDMDHAGLAIRAVIEVNPEALKIAEGGRKGTLGGLPILVKDNIDTADAMQTTAGSLALLGSKPARDAFIIQRLRQAGMVLLGKTNLSEWANMRSPKSSSGWSARGGLTRNPVLLTHSASGSSSGSAAAVAVGYAPGAIGTETNGSIISPASACGIVGLKPTVGLVSRSGIIPITHWQDTAGPMTRTVKDAALLLNVIAGTDPADEQTKEADQRRAVDYTKALRPDALKGKRLGVVREMAGSDAAVLSVFENTLGVLRSAGAVIIDPVALPNQREIGGLSMTAMLVELRTDLNAYLAARGGPVKSLADVIAFNEAHRDEEMPWFGQEFFELAETLGLPEALEKGRQAREAARRLAGPEGIDVALAEHGLDALICPTSDPIGLIDLANGDGHLRVASTPAAVSGFPHLTVPMGEVGGLPVGLSFFAGAWSDGDLLAMGHAFEIAKLS